MSFSPASHLLNYLNSNAGGQTWDLNNYIYNNLYKIHDTKTEICVGIICVFSGSTCGIKLLRSSVTKFQD